MISKILRAICRFVLRWLKGDFPLSAISDVLRRLRRFFILLQKRWHLHVWAIARRLMDNAMVWVVPVIPSDWSIVTHTRGATKPSTTVGVQLQNAEIHTITIPDISDTVCLANAVYSLMPSDTLHSTAQHSPQYSLYFESAGPPLDDEQNQRAVAPDPPVLGLAHASPSSNMAFPYLNNPRIKPVMPEGIMRYEGRHKIAKEFTAMIIQPVTLTFDSSFMPAGWFKCTHPEGGRYFYHSEKNVYTDADLYDYTILHQIMTDLSIMEQFVFHNGIRLPEAYDLVLDLRYGEHGTIETKYYYLHHPTRAVFFLDAFNTSDLNVWYEIGGNISASHLRHEVEAQYWYHIVLYPHSLKVTDQLAHELLDMVLHFSGDVMSSPTSASPFTSEELQQALTLAKAVKHHTSFWQSVGAASLVSRLMHIFARSRFYNYYGERHARLERTASVYSDAENSPLRTWFIKILSPLLFFIPDGNLKSFQKAYVDAIVHQYDWENIMTTLNHEWKQMILLATLMLNVDVGLLSVQGVEPLQTFQRSSAQISIYTSVLFNVGSITLGSLLLKLHKGSGTRDYVNFLAKANHPIVGLEKPAILYSLPCALAIWSLIAFLVGVFFLCFERSSIKARTIVGAMSTIIILFSLATWASWDNDLDNRYTTPSQTSSGLGDGTETGTEETLPKTKFGAFKNLWRFPKSLQMTLHLRKSRSSTV